MDLAVLGIDVGKFEFHCALSVRDQVQRIISLIPRRVSKDCIAGFRTAMSIGYTRYGSDRWLERGARYGSARARSW